MKRFATSVLTVVSVLAQAASPPALSYVARIPSRSLTGPPKIEVMLGDVPIEREKTTLADVIARASRGDIKHVGDAAGSTYWVCYSVTQDLNAHAVWLLSGEMGGVNHAILEVRVSSLAPTESGVECPALPAGMRPVTVAGSIKSGAPSSVLSKALDLPSANANGWHGFRYEIKIPSNFCNGGADRSGAIAAEVEDGKIVAMGIQQVTSC